MDDAAGPLWPRIALWALAIIGAVLLLRWVISAVVGLLVLAVFLALAVAVLTGVIVIARSARGDNDR